MNWNWLPDASRDLMVKQYNLITRPQLLSAGLTDDQVDGRVRRRILEIVQCGTYRQPAFYHPPEQPHMAAVLRCRPSAWLTGEPVLALLGVEGFDLDCTPHVLVPQDRAVQNVSFTVSTDPDPTLHRASVANIPAVSASRAMADAAPNLEDKRFEVALDSLRWLRLSSAERLGQVCLQLPGDHGGAQRLLAHIAAGGLEQASPGERALAPAFEGVQPAPRWGVWVTADIQVDAVIDELLLVFEYDGGQHHGPARRAADAEREQRLRALGYDIVRLNKDDLRDLVAARAKILAIIANRYAEIRRQLAQA